MRQVFAPFFGWFFAKKHKKEATTRRSDALRKSEHPPSTINFPESINFRKL